MSRIVRAWAVAGALSCGASPLPDVRSGTVEAPVSPASSAGLPTAAPEVGLAPGTWTTLGPGVEFAVWDTDTPRILGDGRIRVVRIDPTRAEVVVASGAHRTAPRWGEALSALAVINAGMFHPDGSSVFYLRHQDGVSQPAWHPQASSALVVDGRGARLVSTRCGEPRPGPDAIAVAQSYRLLGCAGEPTWTPGKKIWSHAVIGMDREGRLLLIHARTPWHTRTFSEVLLALPLGLTALQYAEGGPEASLWVDGDGPPGLWVGSYETGFTEHDANDRPWRIPAVVAVRSRP